MELAAVWKVKFGYQCLFALRVQVLFKFFRLTQEYELKSKLLLVSEFFTFYLVPRKPQFLKKCVREWSNANSGLESHEMSLTFLLLYVSWSFKCVIFQQKTGGRKSGLQYSNHKKINHCLSKLFSSKETVLELTTFNLESSKVTTMSRNTSVEAPSPLSIKG